MKITILVSLIISSSAFASGGEQGHVSDLFAPFINVIILMSLLIWKLKGPITSFFDNKSNQVSEVLERASVKAKEAEMMMQMQQQKAQGLEAELNKINTEATTSIEKFRHDYALEIEDRVKKIKEDAVQKIEAEKKQMFDQVNSLLLDEVISKSKQLIKSDENTGNKVTENILQGLK